MAIEFDIDFNFAKIYAFVLSERPLSESKSDNV